jgi:glycosyltransferase involved in cell wall biosynthesis
MKVIAVIPAYNEALMITKVVNQAKKYCDEVIVVDDYSTDRTPYIIHNLHNESIRCFPLSENSGAGFATELGVNIALHYKADIIVTLDGDGQHNPDDIPWLLKPILKNEADITIGTRLTNDYIKRNMPNYRQFGNNILTWLYNFGYKAKISDSQCGFRAFNSKVFDKIQIKEKGFGFIVEQLIKARKLQLRVKEVPVTCIYHDDFKLNSSMNPLKHGLITALKTVYWRIRLCN